MCDFDTDPLRDRPQNPERRTLYDHSFADSNRPVAYHLRCRVLEQTIQHLFLSESPRSDNDARTRTDSDIEHAPSRA